MLTIDLKLISDKKQISPKNLTDLPVEILKEIFIKIASDRLFSLRSMRLTCKYVANALAPQHKVEFSEVNSMNVDSANTLLARSVFNHLNYTDLTLSPYTAAIVVNKGEELEVNGEGGLLQAINVHIMNFCDENTVMFIGSTNNSPLSYLVGELYLDKTAPENYRILQTVPVYDVIHLLTKVNNHVVKSSSRNKLSRFEIKESGEGEDVVFDYDKPILLIKALTDDFFLTVSSNVSFTSESNLGSELTLWSIRDHKPLQSWDKYKDITACTLIPKRSWLVLGTESGRLVILNFEFKHTEAEGRMIYDTLVEKDLSKKIKKLVYDFDGILAFHPNNEGVRVPLKDLPFTSKRQENEYLLFKKIGCFFLFAILTGVILSCRNEVS